MQKREVFLHEPSVLRDRGRSESDFLLRNTRIDPTFLQIFYQEMARRQNPKILVLSQLARWVPE